MGQGSSKMGILLGFNCWEIGLRYWSLWGQLSLHRCADKCRVTATSLLQQICLIRPTNQPITSQWWAQAPAFYLRASQTKRTNRRIQEVDRGLARSPQTKTTESVYLNCKNQLDASVSLRPLPKCTCTAWTRGSRSRALHESTIPSLAPMLRLPATDEHSLWCLPP